MVIFAHQNHTDNEDKQSHGRNPQYHVPEIKKQMEMSVAIANRIYDIL
jgi:hypothetical protein